VNGPFRIMPRRRREGRGPVTDPAIRAMREVRRRRRLAVIPSLFTLGNGVCGFAAIVQIASLRFDLATKAIANPENLAHAGWLILLAMVFDGLDGRIARMTKSTGDFGGELDSLCDAVSFGVAPGLLVAMANAKAITSPLFAKIGWLFGLAMCCGAILRLARFNVENTHEDEAHLSFKGLPSPAAAGTVASLALFQSFLRSDREVVSYLAEPAVLHRAADAISFLLPFLALVVGYLMVSTVRYIHLPNRYLRGKKSIRKIARMVFVAIIFFAIFPEVGLALAFLGYAASGPIAAVWRGARGGPAGEEGAVTVAPAPPAAAEAPAPPPASV
jgi:CDP-diacylglycerol--serine O-phosphatidyltransferase